MNPKTRAKVTASTQEHLEVADVVDDLVLTKSGSVALVIQTNAVNFDLLSEYEQDNKIMAFGGLLNSLNFYVQILIKTQRIDIGNYIQYLKDQQKKEMSPGLARQLEIYVEFVQNLIVTNDVLDKKFYLIIPYNPGVIATGAKLKKSKKDTPTVSSYTREKIIEQAKIFLYPKRDHLIKQLARMGLMAHHVTSQELIQLFYEIYNPSVE